MGWLLDDFAIGIINRQDHPQVPALRKSLTKEYRLVRTLSDGDKAENDTDFILPGTSFLVCNGIHFETPEPQAKASQSAAGKDELLQRFTLESSIRVPG